MDRETVRNDTESCGDSVMSIGQRGRRVPLSIGVCLWSVVCVCGGRAASASPNATVFIALKDTPQYHAVTDPIMTALKPFGVRLKFLFYENTTPTSELGRDLAAARPEALIALDNKAIEDGLTYNRGMASPNDRIAIVGAMGLALAEYGERDGLTVVPYEAPIAIALRRYEELAGRLGRVAVVYDELKFGSALVEASKTFGGELSGVDVSGFLTDVNNRRDQNVTKGQREIAMAVVTSDAIRFQKPVDAVFIVVSNEIVQGSNLATWIESLRSLRKPIICGVRELVGVLCDYAVSYSSKGIAVTVADAVLRGGRGPLYPSLVHLTAVADYARLRSLGTTLDVGQVVRTPGIAANYAARH